MFELNSMSLRTDSNGNIELLDQRKLPQQVQWIQVNDFTHLVELIQCLAIRGAPAIGLAAIAILAKMALQGQTPTELRAAATALRHSRPTAINLINYLNAMTPLLQDTTYTSENVINKVHAIFNDDIDLCDRIAEHGQGFTNDGDSILTHCNTGGLATAGTGTALGIIKHAHTIGKNIHVYVNETRPLLQGARLTAWELNYCGIPYTLISDTMAATLMSQNKIQSVFVGADRIAMNGDFANKVGTLTTAICAQHYQVPFFTAAPVTSIDPQCPNGEAIPIEQRHADEVLGVKLAHAELNWSPKNTSVFNPAFDITPSNLLTGIVLNTGFISQAELHKGKLQEHTKWHN